MPAYLNRFHRLYNSPFLKKDDFGSTKTTISFGINSKVLFI